MDSNLIFNILFIIFSLWAVFTIIFIFPKFIYKRKKSSKDIEVINNIINSSEQILRVNNGGKIGNVNLTASLLDVQFYKKGLIIKPFIFGNVFLLKSEIINVVEWKGISISGIKIEHSSDILKSPLIIYSKELDKIKSLLK